MKRGGKDFLLKKLPLYEARKCCIFGVREGSGGESGE